VPFNKIAIADGATVNENNNDNRKALFTFLSRMNHDLRTPLTAMLNMIGLIKEDPQRHCTLENLELIQEAGEELKALLQDITDLARLEAGVLALKTAPFALRELLDQAVSQFASDAAQKNLDLRIEVGKGVPDRIVADKDRLKRVLLHLISNAVTYSEKGGVVVRVIRIAPEKELEGHLDLQFSVEDSGAGIAESMQEQLFDRFLIPAGDGLTKTSTGRGLGLALCKRLVHLMGGSLSVQSLVGTGSTFTFDLPVLGSEKPSDPAPGSAKIDLTAFGPLRILVVEDNFINLLSFSQMLERCGFSIESASNGKQAVDLIEKAPFDIVLMDVKMPVMDGLEATSRIRRSNNPRVRTTRIVALTAYAMPEDRQRIMAAGMNDVVTKPIEVEELADVLRRVLGKEWV
jgi:CheY-like chemotaxis protein